MAVTVSSAGRFRAGRVSFLFRAQDKANEMAEGKPRHQAQPVRTSRDRLLVFHTRLLSYRHRYGLYGVAFRGNKERPHAGPFDSIDLVIENRDYGLTSLVPFGIFGSNVLSGIEPFVFTLLRVIEATLP